MPVLKLNHNGIISEAKIWILKAISWSHTKALLEYGYLSISPIFTKMITALRTALANEYSLDKEATSYDDCFDALHLSLRHYDLHDMIHVIYT